MSHFNSARNLAAQLAAQWMYEHGINDFALAKRKAARQLGIIDAHHLPNNSEIEAAIREHLSIFHAESHPNILIDLQNIALRTMQKLADFNPHLTGSVLNGTAGQCADIHIELFTDSEKEVEMYLLNQKISFRQAQAQVTSARGQHVVPCYRLPNESNEIILTVLPQQALRNTRRVIGTDVPKRASLKQLTSMLSTQDPNTITGLTQSAVNHSATCKA
jgi:hypothetical protein